MGEAKVCYQLQQNLGRFASQSLSAWMIELCKADAWSQFSKCPISRVVP